MRSGSTLALVASKGRQPPQISPSASDPRKFHATLPGYEATPLRTMPAVARWLGIATVLVKDESRRLELPSFKVLGASWAVYRALLARLGATAQEIPTFALLSHAARQIRPLTLSAATDGNHGRAVARIAALLGADAKIYMPRNAAKARITAIESEGAGVTVVDGGYDDAVRRAAADASQHCLVISDTSWEGYEQVPSWVVEGYATVFDEIEEALDAGEHARPDVVVIQIGVGALAAAAVRHFYRLSKPRPLLIGVEPSSAACMLESVAADRPLTLDHPQDSIMAGLNCGTPSLIAWPLVSRGLDAYVAISDVGVPEALRVLATDGVVAGETGAAGLAGLMALLESPEAEAARAALELKQIASALVICTEGATDPEAYRKWVGPRGNSSPP